MSDDRGPMVHQELLIQYLVALRHEHGMTQQQVGKELDWSHAKVMRYEGSKQTLPQSDLDALLDLYKVASVRKRELRELGRRARERGWWSPHANRLDPSYRRFIGLEAGADTILQLEPSVVPGLLQTYEYARCVTRLWTEEAEVEPLVGIRMRRQSALSSRTPRPRQIYLLDENVIRKHIGVAKEKMIMPRQLHHLAQMANTSEIEIRVIPDGQGEHFGLSSSSMALLKFDTDLRSKLYREHDNVCSMSDSKDEIGQFIEKFTKTREHIALSPDKSLALIEQHAETMQRT
ncbi:helix-turn-helix domain-containing protein [Nocardiopsis terrae]